MVAGRRRRAGLRRVVLYAVAHAQEHSGGHRLCDLVGCRHRADYARGARDVQAGAGLARGRGARAHRRRGGRAQCVFEDADALTHERLTNAHEYSKNVHRVRASRYRVNVAAAFPPRFNAYLQRMTIERFFTLADTTLVMPPPAVPPSSLSFDTMSYPVGPHALPACT